MKLTIDVPQEILDLAERLRTQDSRATETPRFVVQEWRGIRGWVTRQSFLTEEAAEIYLRENLHHFNRPKDKQKQPRVYVEGGYRNYELSALRAFLMALPKAAAAPSMPKKPGKVIMWFRGDAEQTVDVDDINDEAAIQDDFDTFLGNADSGWNVLDDEDGDGA